MIHSLSAAMTHDASKKESDGIRSGTRRLVGRCGANEDVPLTTAIAETLFSGWASDVTCPDCLAGGKP